MTKTPTLVANRLYFGLDARRLRDSTDRVLARVIGVPPERATVALQDLARDFQLDAATSRKVADEMERDGLIERLSPSGMEFAITDRFRALATARVIRPLPRADAHALLSQLARLAAEFNRTASANKYEIAALAVFGSYLSLDEDLPEVSLGVTGRRRPPVPQPSSGRATRPVEGSQQIRELLEGQSSYLRVGFYNHLQDVPRPFSVIFKD